ncbi:MAG: co-chaperone GroES [Nitrospirae bacterium]|nr:MAG: co-chaperone GroES [Nitrospirota bacterium]
MKIRPLNDWVVIKATDAEERTAGGIIIPEVAKKKPQWGTVEAVGPGAYETKKGSAKKDEKKFIPCEVRPGQHVLYERYMGSEFELDGQQILMVREKNILGILEDSGAGSTALQKKSSTDLQAKGPSALQKKAANAVEPSKKAPAKKKTKK